MKDSVRRALLTDFFETVEYRESISKSFDEIWKWDSAKHPRDKDGKFAGGHAGLARAMVSAVKTDGGFTFDKLGSSFTEGLSVGAFPHLSGAFDAKTFSKQDAAKWLKKCQRLVKDKRLAIGGWHDTDSGKVWLDVVRVYPQHQKDIALAVGRKKNQIAIADLGAISRGQWDRAIINTGGDGLAKRASSKGRYFMLPITATPEELVAAVKGKVSKMFEDIWKYVEAEHPRDDDGRWTSKGPSRGFGGGARGGEFSSDAMIVGAGTQGAPVPLRRAAIGFAKGGMVRAGRHLDSRMEGADQHHRRMEQLMHTVSPVHGLTMKEAIAKAESIPSTMSKVDTVRKQMHSEKISEHILRKRDELGGEFKKGREVHIVMGLPGSGKSALEGTISKRIGAMTIDSDDYKQMLPEFDNGLGANAVHQESKIMAERTRRAMMRHGVNLVIPVIGSKEKDLKKEIRAYQKKGYKVTVHLVDVPNKFSQQRVVERYVRTGRAIPLAVVQGYGDRPRSSFDHVRKLANSSVAYSSHEIPGGKIRYAVLGSTRYKVPRQVSA